MNVLVTGNLGYIGSVLTPVLAAKGYRTVGVDTSLFTSFNFRPPPQPNEQLTMDIRDLKRANLNNIDIIIHLAALADNYLCALVPDNAYDINYRATLRLGKLAKQAGVKLFIFASSQNIYGPNQIGSVSENSKPKPEKIYGKTKLLAETGLKKLVDSTFNVVFLRPSVVSGASPAMHVDTVLNDLVAAAIVTNTIRVKSDGSPSRPIVHVQDLAAAITSIISTPSTITRGQAFNIGRADSNHTIREMAEHIKKQLPNCQIKFTKQHGPDPRTYTINFDKINTKLKKKFYPQWTIAKTIKNLIDFYRTNQFSYADYISDKHSRIHQLQSLIYSHQVDENLYVKQ